MPASPANPPLPALPAIPAHMVARAQLTCTSSAGKVTAIAACKFTDEYEHDGKDIDITDTEGHSVSVGIYCGNG
jgi:hypothetical protein